MKMNFVADSSAFITHDFLFTQFTQRVNHEVNITSFKILSAEFQITKFHQETKNSFSKNNNFSRTSIAHCNKLAEENPKSIRQINWKKRSCEHLAEREGTDQTASVQSD